MRIERRYTEAGASPYETIAFNYPLNDYSGGGASEIDWRDLDP